MKVLVTGISGFIGSHLAERLIKEGCEVAGFARQTNRLSDKTYQSLLGKARMYYGSLCDPVAVERMVSDFRPDAICALGAISPVAYSFEHPDEVTRTNYLGQIYLAEAALKHCERLRKFIFAGSMEEYGFNPKRTPFVEEDELQPACPYAVAKVAFEKYTKYLHYAHNFPAITFRQTNAYGRRSNSYFIVEAAVTQFLSGKSANFGDPKPERNFIYIDDLVDLYWATLNSGDSANGHTFNTGPANALSIRNLVEEIARLTNFEGQINWYTRPHRPGEIYYLCSSAEKAKNLLNWEPKVSLEDGLKRTIAIWRENLNIKERAPYFNSVAEFGWHGADEVRTASVG